MALPLRTVLLAFVVNAKLDVDGVTLVLQIAPYPEAPKYPEIRPAAVLFPDPTDSLVPSNVSALPVASALVLLA